MALVCADSGLVNLGKATPSNYELIIAKVPTEDSISAINPLVLNVFSTVIPGVSLSEEVHGYQAAQTKHAQAPMLYEQLSVGFVVDSLFENWKLLTEWMKFINDNSEKMAERHKIYAVDATLAITDNYRKAIMAVRFVDIWPITIAEVSLSQREGETQVECSATFNYDYFLIEE